MLFVLLEFPLKGYAAYNQLYRITDVAIGSATTVTVAAASSIPSTGISSDTVGVGVTLTGDAYAYLTGEAIRVNTFTYTGPAGIATITTHNQTWFSSGSCCNYQWCRSNSI